MRVASTFALNSNDGRISSNGYTFVLTLTRIFTHSTTNSVDKSIGCDPAEISHRCSHP
jgi:hypothetical protein